jgi:Zn-dependent protease with chaperone function
VNPTFLCVLLCELALTSWLLSALVGLLLRWNGPALDHLAPDAARRLLLAATFAPVLFPSIVGAALFVDSVWGSHLNCPERFKDSAIEPWAVLLGALWLSRSALSIGRLLRDVLVATRTRQELDLLSVPDARGFQKVALDEPIALTMGFVSPAAYLSTGLLQKLDTQATASVLAHERSHIRHADPLARLLCGLALALHLPGVARTLTLRLHAAEEARADEEAAAAVGDRLAVAESLVRCARLQLQVPLTAGITSSPLEARVCALLASAPRSSQPSAEVLLVALLALTGAALLGSPYVHLFAEHLFELATR